MKNVFLSEDINFFRDFTNFLEARKKENTEIMGSVRKVIEDVKINKDAAVIKYTKKFDKIDLDRLGFFFERNEIEGSIKKIETKDRTAIDLSIARIFDFHKKQMPTNLSWSDELGIELGWVWKPIERVGVYVPGGKASYPSSAIMNIAPAKIAGVEDIVLASPSPNGLYNPLMIYASSAMDVYEPPIPTALEPTPIDKNLAAVVPALSTPKSKLKVKIIIKYLLYCFILFYYS